MPIRPFLLPLVAAALVGPVAPAAAAPVAASADDPVGDGAGGPTRDLEQVRSTFDAGAGTWTVTVRLAAPASTDAWAMINAALYTPSGDPADCVHGAAKQVATLRASTKPGTTSVFGSAGTYDDGPQPDGSTGPSPFAHVERSASADGREVTLTASSPRLTGRAAGCVTLTLSYQNAVQDTLAPPARFAVDPPAPLPPAPGPSPSSPGPSSAPGPDARPVIRLAAGTKVLRRGRDGRIAVRLRAFTQPLSGSAELRIPGVTLGAGRWTAAAGRPVTVRLRLTAAGRRHLRRHARTTVTLRIGAAVPRAAVVVRRFTLTLRR